MSLCLWKQCLDRLQKELPTKEFSIWIRSLKAKLNNNILEIYAPNKFILDWVQEKYSGNFKNILKDLYSTNLPEIKFYIYDEWKEKRLVTKTLKILNEKNTQILWNNIPNLKKLIFFSNVNKKHNFENFIEGNSNYIARSAAFQVTKHLGNFYNPLFLYGSTGLGKTHLLHAIGNRILTHQYNIKIMYMHSERFVQKMVKALKNNSIEKFKLNFRSVNALLIDDIQFFAYKERSQEEFFHTLNSLLERNQQIILTADRYPKEIHGVEDRLKSRFSWGLTVSINPPELETRIAILIKKADENNILLSKEVAFFIAKNLRSNVRELEGALNRIIIHAHLTNNMITIDFVRKILQDILIMHEKIITIDNIQKTVSEYYKIKITELLSKRRSRSISHPRQMAMAITKQLTHYSLSEIGKSFCGRDHTTVLHACRKIKKLRETSKEIKKDFFHLIQTLLM